VIGEPRVTDDRGALPGRRGAAGHRDRRYYQRDGTPLVLAWWWCHVQVRSGR
jgi:hypothetical protein